MLSEEQQKSLMQKQPQLSQQTYDQIPQLSVLSFEVISRQATINIGTIGHVAHGKSTLVKAITGVHTVRFRDEKVRNITIKLGYANAKIYKCQQCNNPEAYKSFSSDKEDLFNCDKCKSPMVLQRHVSFVDCPGHDILMATMLTGAAVMDACLLLIAGNMSCPQPQTSEHLAAVEIMQLNKIIIVQNKVDLIFRDPNAANKNYEEIKKFIQGTRAENSPIIPISAQFNYNIDTVCQYITEYIPVPKRLLNDSPKLIIIRSFDVNKPGDDVENMKGGIVGGSIINGILKIGDNIEIRPGEISRNQNGQFICTSIQSKIVTLKAGKNPYNALQSLIILFECQNKIENNDLLYAAPGGLIGVGLRVDPTLTRSNRLVGQVLGHPGHLPEVYSELEIEFHMLRRLLGVKTDDASTNKVKKINKSETLMLNVGSTQTGGRVEKVQDKIMRLSLAIPVCTSTGEKVAISRRIEDKWRLIGWGNVKTGNIINS